MKQGGAFFVEVLVSIVISALLTALLQVFIKDITISEQIVIGLSILIASALFRNNYYLHQNTESVNDVAAKEPIWDELRLDVRRLLSIQHNLEILSPKIREISDGIRVVANRYSGEDDLFEPWYDDKLDGLLGHIRHTLDTESFYFTASLLNEHDRIFGVFKGRKTDFFYATATCAGVSWYATPIGDSHVRGIYEKFKSKALPDVKRIFIYDKRNELDAFAVKLVLFLHAQSGYQCRVIAKDLFESVILGFEDRTLVWDFGIYGTHFVWETPQEEYVHIRYGEVCVNKHRIELYTRVFRKLWTAAEQYVVDGAAFAEYATMSVVDYYTIMRSNHGT